MTLTQYLDRPEGRLGYDVVGPAEAPLVVAAPGMGDLRSSYRHLVPLLVERGFRVATLDLRGHGDSDATFTAYDNVALAGDLLALVDELGGQGLLVGNSLAAGAAVIAAAERPEAVTGLALLGPFVRDPDASRFTTAMFRLAMLRPWAPAAFLSYYPKWVPGVRPEGYDDHVAALRDSFRRPGHAKAFVRTTRTSHRAAEERLGEVSAPAVVVMGDADVDWPDPAAEAHWIGERLGAPVVMAPGVGHYPQSQSPVLVADAVEQLAKRADAGA